MRAFRKPTAWPAHLMTAKMSTGYGWASAMNLATWSGVKHCMNSTDQHIFFATLETQEQRGRWAMAERTRAMSLTVLKPWKDSHPGTTRGP